MAYVTTAQVVAHLPYRTIDGSSSPSTTDIDGWIDEAEAVLNGALSAAQIVAPVTSANGVKICRAWVTDAVVGTLRMAFAAAGGDPNNNAGQDQLDKFNDRINEIINNPQRYAMILGGGAGTTASRQLRSHVTDNLDGKTAADFEPTFSTSTEF